MIVVDTSALYAILANEPEAEDFTHALSRDDAPQVSAPTLYETMIVCYARGGAALLQDLQQLLVTGNIAVVPFDRQAADAAHAAYQQFGRGYHPASLNLGDCAAYSLAATLGCRLLYKGDDFTKTGISPAGPFSSAPSAPPSSPPSPTPE
jgi:ribonuclease VapC